VLVALVGLCVVLGVVALSKRGDNEVATDGVLTTNSVGTTIPDGTSDFLDAFAKTFVGPYSVTGVLEFSNDQAATRQTVRRARLDDRSLDQIGGGAEVTNNGNLRRCSDDRTQFLCTDPEPEPTIAQRRAEMARLLVQDVGYVVAQESDSCYVLTARGDGTFSPFGIETTYCFDPATGAVSSRVTTKGQRTESFIASQIKSEVTEQDLTPL
jgi:hypothetical protein